MLLRKASILAAAPAALALAALAALPGSAAAQGLPPPGPYPQDGYSRAPGSIIGAPEDDEDIGRLPPPGAAQPYPDRRPYYPSASDPRFGRQNAPSPNEAYPGEPRDARLPQPSIVAPEPYPEPQVVRRPPGFGAPAHDEPQGQAPGYGAPQMARPGGDPVLRPPAVIEPRAPMMPQTGQPGPGAAPQRPVNLAALPPEEQPEEGEPKELPPQFRRQVVPYQTKEPAGTIVIDTASTFLYYVNGDGTAVRYGIGVGREGFTWAGVERITRKAEWPDWHPPAEMIERQPYLPRFMAGGPGNPMGARALYLGKTIYRVHGTNQPSTIGKFVSSGCIRMLNEDVEDLYERVKIGSKVVVLPGGPSSPSAAASTPAAR